MTLSHTYMSYMQVCSSRVRYGYRIPSTRQLGHLLSLRRLYTSVYNSNFLSVWIAYIEQGENHGTTTIFDGVSYSAYAYMSYMHM